MKKTVDPKTLKWMRKPKLSTQNNNRLVIETEPYSSFQAARFDATNAFGMELEPMKNVCFTVRVDYHFNHIDDECGIFMKYDNTHWLKCGCENRSHVIDLACTAYLNGYGDRSCREIGNGIRWIYFRVLYLNGNVRFQYSFNGKKFSDMRSLHLNDTDELAVIGIYACSPQDCSFDCTFLEMTVQEL